MRVCYQYVVAHGVSGQHVVRVAAAPRIAWPVSDLTGVPTLFCLKLGAVKVCLCNEPTAALGGMPSTLQL